MIKQEGLVGWKQALLLALGLHIALFSLFFFYPSIWHKKVKITSSYNVQLFEPSAMKNLETPPAVRPKIAQKMSKPLVKKRPSKAHVPKELPKKRTVQKLVGKKKPVAERKVSKKAISLRPKKVQRKNAKKRPEKKKVKRVVKKQRTRDVDEDKRLSQRLKKIEERVREKEEEKILQERLASIKKKVHEEASPVGGSSTASGVKASVSDALRRYAGSVWMHVRKNWHFPEELLKRKDIEAIVSIRIDKAGHILSKRFEQRSGFAAFDRSVMKAVQDSDPLPPLPVQLGSGPIEIGIRFNPSRMNSPGILQGA